MPYVESQAYQNIDFFMDGIIPVNKGFKGLKIQSELSVNAKPPF